MTLGELICPVVSDKVKRRPSGSDFLSRSFCRSFSPPTIDDTTRVRREGGQTQGRDADRALLSMVTTRDGGVKVSHTP
jgi:hypothetical protein